MLETQGGWEKHERPLELMELLEQSFPLLRRKR